MEYLITIVITNFKSAEFILLSLQCLEILTKNAYKVLIRDNNSPIKDHLKLKKNILNYDNVELYRVEDVAELGSFAHGESLDDLVPRINTKYGVILDSDCVFLHPDWDEILISRLNDEYPIIGTQHISWDERFTLGNDFPLMHAILFKNDIMQQLKIKFLPKGDIGDQLNFKDTGHELEEKYKANGYKGKLIAMKNTRTYKEGPFQKLVGVGEYYLDGYNKIFASHFGRGSTLGMAKYYKGWKKKIYRIPIIGSFLLKSKGKKEKRKWIKICETIIKNYQK